MGIPTVDLSPFFKITGDDDDDDHIHVVTARKEAIEIIKRACSEYGFFQIVNHGVPLHLISRAVKLCQTFFSSPSDQKLKYSPGSAAPLPAGYSKQPENSPDKNEYLLMFEPQSPFNIFPRDPPELRDVLEEMFRCFRKTGEIMDRILNDCLGLPLGFLEEYNDDRSCDFMVALRYFPATETENNGISEHEDGNCVTFVIQDVVGGLEVNKDGIWVPVIPEEATIVVNLADVMQVLSNGKFKSATHRVVRPKEKSRHSFAFFYNMKRDKWIEPLPQFTQEIGEAPKYKGFFYRDYQAMRLRNKTHPPSNPQDAITLSHYAIPK